MKILISGFNGFIGKNLVEALAKFENVKVLAFDKHNNISQLSEYTEKCNTFIHLAAVHRPSNINEYKLVNHLLFAKILKLLRKYKNNCPIIFTSSIQAEQNNYYGKSKLAAEQELILHSQKMNSIISIYRLTNTFGRYAKPNHHSVVANFCHNIVNNRPITIVDPEYNLFLYYVDDVVDSLISNLFQKKKPDTEVYYRLPQNLTYSTTLKLLAEKLYHFKSCVDRNINPEHNNEFSKKLYETFLYYLKHPE